MSQKLGVKGLGAVSHECQVPEPEDVPVEASEAIGRYCGWTVAIRG
jgi:hypothetical protein